jgi:hypothetical protein
MATTASLGAQAHEAMKHSNEILEEHLPGHAAKMRLLTVTGSPPVKTGNADELMRILCYQSEQIASLVDLVDGLVKAGASKKPGRPRKEAA